MNETQNGTTPCIMILDDEEMVLTSLRSFLELETDYEIVTFNKGQEALSYANENRVDLVISDYLMPEMDGITFLSKMKEIDPHTTRIILTGYADKENAIKAINEVGLYQYIEKPWDNDNLKLIIRNGLDKQELIRELDRKVAEIQQIHRDILKAFA